IDSGGRPIPDAVIRSEGGTLQVSAPGFLPWSGAAPAKGKGPLRVVLLHPASLRGRVTSNGVALRGFSVRVKYEHGSATAAPAKVSGKADAYAIEALAPGLQTLALEAAGQVSLERSVSLREGEVRWLSFDLHPASQLIATTLDGKSNPLAGVEAEVRIDGTDGRFLDDAEKARVKTMLATSDKKGRLALGPLAQGLKYRIVFRLEGRPRRSLDLTPSTPSVARPVSLP